jgi:ubiquinone/menaquinone biosynthesis C-methylase UbiE/uncharacterized protein YbaR (Trm112 family)
MNDRVRQILQCPACGDPLVDQGTDGGKGAPTGFRCESCCRVFPIKAGIPRMTVSSVETEHVARSFGFQWGSRHGGRFEQSTLYGLTAQQECEAFFEAYGITARDLQGKTILDAGCGDGALVELLARHACEVVGIDIHTSIAVPHQRCKNLSNVTILQADISRPCFLPACFDFVWCEGVIVHTRDPKQAFFAVSPLVKPGGRLYLWVYPAHRRSIYQRTRDLLVAPYLIPRPALLYLCYGIAGCMYPIFHLTGRRRSLGTIAFALFDNLSPRYQWRHTEEEIRSWFTEAGFANLKLTGHIGMSGTRPYSLPAESAMDRQCVG